MKSHSCLGQGADPWLEHRTKSWAISTFFLFYRRGPVFASIVSKWKHVWWLVVESEINSSFQTVETAKCFQYAPRVGDGGSIEARCPGFQNYFLAYLCLLSQPPSPPFNRGGREGETRPILLLRSFLYGESLRW